MQTVGIKVLKDKLSEYIRAAAAGETVLVTDRGRVVAEIIAPRNASEHSTPEQRMAELVRQGLVTPAKIPPETPMPPRQQSLIPLEDVLRDLDESREDR